MKVEKNQNPSNFDLKNMLSIYTKDFRGKMTQFARFWEKKSNLPDFYDKFQ
jgi:hypothetical protein